jgi:hypothetical protein
LDRRPRARNAAESEFLDLGEGARLWLVEAAAVGTPRMRVKMNEALALAKLFDPVEVDWALGHAARPRRAAAGFPTGKTFDARQPDVSSIPAPTQQALHTLEWVHRRENVVVCGPSGPGRRSCSRHSVKKQSRKS